jgi:hypothetical protein
MAMPLVIAFVKRVLIVAALAVVLIYLADWARVARQPHTAPGDPALDTLTFWLATPLKNGRVEVFYDQPQTEVCVRALFPHFGRRPCWYARRERIHI